MSQVLQRPPLVLMESYEAKAGPVCASSSSQAKHSSERVQLKLGQELEVLSSSKQWDT